MSKRLAVLLLAASIPAAAGELPSIPSLAQDQFRRLSEDLGAAVAYKGVTPATNLGTFGFDLGLELSATEIKNSDAFRLAGNSGTDYIYVPKVHLSKGLPFGLDIGGFVGGASEINATVYGLDARYAVIEDSMTTPALALRLSGTRTSDMGALRVATIGGDVMLSKRLTLATPYIGAGVVRVDSQAKGTSLADETFNKSRVFLGVNLNFAILNLALEAEKLGDNNTFSAKAGWRF